MCFFADRANAPYGTKTKDELIPLVKRDVDILLDFGAERILMACCTASTVWEYLPKRYKDLTVPIIVPVAEKALSTTRSGRIGVIATKRTVDSHAFRDALANLDSALTVTEICTQSFVDMAESGIYEREEIDTALRPLADKKIDTLILGCTHFSHLAKIISDIMGDVRIIDSAKTGAEKILSMDGSLGNGLTYFL